MTVTAKIKNSIAAALAVISLCSPGTLNARHADEERVQNIAPALKRELDALACMSPSSLQTLAASVSPEAIEAQARDILSLGSLYIGKRPVNKDGQALIHQYIESRLEALEPFGVQRLGGIESIVAVPVPAEPRIATGAQIVAGTAEFAAYPLWPNGAMPSLCPPGGISAPLVDAVNGEWDDIYGKQIKDAIVLLNFKGGRNMERLFSLGCKAVLVVEDTHVNRINTRYLYCNTPVPQPRFYITVETAEHLRNNNLQENVNIEGGHIYENRKIRSIFAYLPPTPPLVYKIAKDDLLARIAADNNVTTESLISFNDLNDSTVTPGTLLHIPDSKTTYTVNSGDLLARIASQYGLSRNELLEANNLSSEELTPGQELTIPNAPDAMLLLTPIDSISVAPDAPHGARTAANIASMLASIEHLARNSSTVRRKGLLIGFIDGDTMGGMGSRAFAEQAMIMRGDIQSQAGAAQTAGQSFYRFLAMLLSSLAFMGITLLLLHYLAVPLAAPVRISLIIIIILCGLFTGSKIPLPKVRGNIVLTDDILLERYERGMQWFEQPADAALDADTADWLLNEWLLAKVDKQRVNVAEERVIYVNRILQEELPPDEKDAAISKRNELDRLIDFFVELRAEVLDNRNLTDLEKLQQYYGVIKKHISDNSQIATLNIAPEDLQKDFNKEYREQQQLKDISDRNQVAIKDILAKLKTEETDQNTGHLAWVYDFSSGSHSLGMNVGINSENATRNLAGFSIRNTVQISKRYRDLLAFATIRAGWPEEWTYLIEEDRLQYPITASPAPDNLYPDLWSIAHISLRPFTTLNDQNLLLDTPRDLPEKHSWNNFAIQARTALTLIKTGLESPLDSMAPNMKSAEAGRVHGKTLRFNIRSGIDAQEPVPGVWVYYPAIPKKAVENNSSVLRGGRRGIVIISKLNGQYNLPVETRSFFRASKPVVYAYRLNHELAVFDMVMDQGQIGTQKQNSTILITEGQDTEKRLIMTEAVPFVFSIGTDPRDYRSLGEGREIKIIDAVRQGEPAHFALINPNLDYSESGVDSNILFMPEGRRARIMFRETGQIKMLLSGAITEQYEKGYGYQAGMVNEDGELLTDLPMATIAAARDMYQQAGFRQEMYARFGITDRQVAAALDRCGELLEETEQAVAEKDWQFANGRAREAWGILVNFFPRIMNLGRQAVFSAIILMAMLAPAAVFLEKIIIGRKGIIARLIGISIIFALGSLFLSRFHPAFEVAVNPFILIIAFIMILMASIVLSICYQRFEVLVRRARIAGGQAESEEISLSSSLATALSLGMSNLKKRPVHTLLTVFTVSVLTFSVIAFVSVQGKDSLFSKPAHIDNDIEGKTVEAEPPQYEGLLFREFGWANVSRSFASAIRSEFGSTYPVITRGHYVENEGGNNADREGVNQINISFSGKAAIINGVMLFEPGERDFSALHRTVSRETWFDEDDRFTVILPEVVAAQLDISPDMLYNSEGELFDESELPVVRMLNNNWRVIGIMDTEQADRVRDINGKSLAMVDFLRSAIQAGISGHLENETETYHQSWHRFAVAPIAAAGDINGNIKSVAIRLDGDQQEQTRFFDDLALRLNRAMFSNINGELSLLSTKKKQSIGGLAKIIVPVILCILIVSNTMMGGVEERKGEVMMLGAVGLSPSQISFLLLSESTVFSVLGIVFGTFTGLLLANLIPWISAVTGGFMGGLSFNFTSVASMLLALGTGMVVLLATLIPAAKAAALAAPSGLTHWELPEPESNGVIDFSLPFTLTRGNAVGMLAFLRRLMLNHTESTSEDFNCRDIEHRLITTGEDALALNARMWLTPYDLDVAQDILIKIFPTENEGVFGVQIRLHRTSGTEDAWARTNYGFMDIVRRQFLIWRNMQEEQRAEYIQEGARIFQEKTTAKENG